MIYIENIFVCIAIPMLLSLFFTEHRQRVFTLFVIAGMAICLLAAYVSSFFYELLSDQRHHDYDRDHAGLRRGNEAAPSALLLSDL